MPAPKGNKFWEARSSHGRKPTFESPEQLWDAATQYFDWVAENPLQEAIVYQGVLNEDQAKPLMRAMTIDGLCIFLGISHQSLHDYRDKNKDFFEVVTEIKNVIREQKFTGAAAGLLNPNIIARDLGLKDATTNEHSGPDGGPIKTQNETITSTMDPKEASRIYQEMLKGSE